MLSLSSCLAAAVAASERVCAVVCCAVLCCAMLWVQAVMCNSIFRCQGLACDCCLQLVNTNRGSQTMESLSTHHCSVEQHISTRDWRARNTARTKAYIHKSNSPAISKAATKQQHPGL